MSDPGSRTGRWITSGLLVITAVILFPMFRLLSDYRMFALATPLPWAIALAVSPLFRRFARDWLVRQRELADRFASEGGPAPLGLALALVAYPAWLFWLSTGVTFGAVDTRPAVVTSISLVRHGTLDLTSLNREFSSLPPKFRIENGGVPRPQYERQGSKIYSAFPMGMIPLAVPLAYVANLAHADLSASLVQYRFEKLAASTITAIACSLFFLVALRLAPLKVAATATLLLVFGSVVWTVMASGLWQHGGVFLWSMVFLLAELRTTTTGTRRQGHTTLTLAIQGFAGVQLLFCRPSAALFVAFLNLWVFARSWKRGVMLGVINALGLLALFGLNRWLFGDIRGPYWVRIGSGTGNWHLTVESLLGILFSPARGLFVFQPWLLAVVPLSLVVTLRGDDPRRREFLPIAGLVVAHTLLIAAWQDWIGGWCWGPRLLAETVPLWVLLSLPGLKRLIETRRGTVALAGLLTLSVSIHFATVVVPPNDWHRRFQPAPGRPILWSLRDSPFVFAWREGLRR